MERFRATCYCCCCCCAQCKTAHVSWFREEELGDREMGPRVCVCFVLVFFFFSDAKRMRAKHAPMWVKAGQSQRFRAAPIQAGCVFFFSSCFDVLFWQGVGVGGGAEGGGLRPPRSNRLPARTGCFFFFPLP